MAGELERGADAGVEPALQERFQRAAERIRVNTSLRPTDEQRLQLYGFYKQAVTGTCNTSKPGFFDFTGRAKWEAWHKLGRMSAQEAMEGYLKLVELLDPGWETGQLDHSQMTSKEESGGRGAGGPVMSRMVPEDEAAIPDDEKSVFDWCKEGRADRLAAMLTAQNINEKDAEGMALLHWACDRGNLEVVKMLVGRGADVNVQDSDQQTPLHYASSCDQQAVVSYLLSVGVDQTVQDADGLTAEEVASESSTQALFHHQTSPVTQ